MKFRIIILLLLLFTSCDVKKKAIKNKTDTKLTEQIETIKKRKGDTVTYSIPKVTYRDTTIYKKNYVTGTAQVLRFDKQGNVDLAQCISGSVEEITRQNRELIETIKAKDKEKTEEFDSSFILYGFLGIGFILIIVGLVIVFVLKRYINARTS
ncbi:hypothetical protein KORDIASMS9_02671 [Kordia sp. SMS9]|uniref:hypothetical protein n=1 Tax=Kordia sp. SMS9 TaxID=2282170 RepID=UPI000E0DDC80|nr:hypothetical protein [Kordia sp. SMS9]AXG70431.1 hypothetical protein KORDIASMS9_02671 [Kordia sp. SMS9]